MVTAQRGCTTAEIMNQQTTGSVTTKALAWAAQEKTDVSPQQAAQTAATGLRPWHPLAGFSRYRRKKLENVYLWRSLPTSAPPDPNLTNFPKVASRRMDHIQFIHLPKTRHNRLACFEAREIDPCV